MILTYSKKILYFIWILYHYFYFCIVFLTFLKNVSDMVYIFSYFKNGHRYYFIRPTCPHVIDLFSLYVGHFHYSCEIMPYEPVECTFDEFKTLVSGIYGPESCDLTRQDIIEFEFMYNIYLKITDIYE